MVEHWRPAIGFDKYEVSTHGRVRNWVTDRILTPENQKNTRIRVALCNKEGKYVKQTLSHLIANAYIPNPKNHPNVGHRDGDKTNCSVDNLFWAEHKSFYN